MGFSIMIFLSTPFRKLRLQIQKSVCPLKMAMHVGGDSA